MQPSKVAGVLAYRPLRAIAAVLAHPPSHTTPSSLFQLQVIRLSGSGMPAMDSTSGRFILNELYPVFSNIFTEEGTGSKVEIIV